MTAENLSQLGDLIAAARAAGADSANALLIRDDSLSVARQKGRPEKLERAEGL